MSTPVVTPPTPAPAITPTTFVTTTETWLQKHERIIIVFLVLLAATWLGNKWLNVSADRAKQASNIATQQFTAQKANDTALAAQVAQINGQYRVLTFELAQQNAKLASAMTNRTVTLKKQQVTDSTLPVVELDTRWSSLVGFAPNELVVGPTGVTVSDTGARQTVEELEKVPVLTSNLKDETTVAQNQQTELDKANLLVGGLNQQVSSLNLTVTDAQKACTAETNSLKASDRKGKRNWFLRGLAIGGAVVTALVFHV